MGDRLDKGFFGEQGSGFYLGAQGYYFVDGPSGAGGHAANAGGFDGIAYNPKTGDLIIYDNKTYARAGNVASGTAIDPKVNLVQNLDALIAKVEKMSILPDQSAILAKLKATRASISAGTVAPPPGVRIAITNFGGRSGGVSGPLGGRGITFIDMSQSPKVPSQDKYVDRQAVVGMASRAPFVDQAFAARMARGQAVGAAVQAGAQWLNGLALDYALNQAAEECAAEILAAQSRGNGALIIYTITAMGREVTARSLHNTSVEEGKTAQDAIQKWFRTPRLVQGFGRHVTVERRFKWIEPIVPQ